VMTGTVKVGAANIAGALVQAIDNPQFYAYTNNSGVYSFSVSEGSYTLRASSHGYFTQDTPGYISVTSGGSAGYPFQLVTMASGTATGYVYTMNHLVVSAVATSTGTGSNTEYVELYNPTTGPINIGTTASPDVNLYIFDHSNHSQPSGNAAPTPFPTVRISTYVPSHKYYLFASTSSPITIAGNSRTPDAYYASPYSDTLYLNDSVGGGTGIADMVPNKIDALAWRKNIGGTCPTTPLEGNCIVTGGSFGGDEVLLRMTDPGVVNPAYARAYDSDDNLNNFSVVAPIPAAPNSTAQGTATPIAGTPAAGALVNFNDPLSNSAICDTA